MDIGECIEKALDGDAILFVGAGYSVGAVNRRGRPFLDGAGLAAHLAQRAGVKGSMPLEDAAEAFVSKHGEEDLVKELQSEFTTKSISEHHRKLALVPWRRIYTTNYDDIVEESYRAHSMGVTSVTMGDDPYRIPKSQTLCVHLNGFVRKLDLSTVLSELKLTEVSYVSSSVADSVWAPMLRQDISLARSVIFLGYSLYDLDIKRILLDTPLLKGKCFFVLGESPDPTTVRRIERFGTGVQISTKEFASRVDQKRSAYTPVVKDPLSTVSIKECVPSSLGARVTDRALFDLFLFGRVDGDMTSQSLRSTQHYLLERREAIGRMWSLIDAGERLIVLCSDLGNGKSLCLEGLRFRAYERGFRVFEVKERNETAIAELDAIARSGGKVLVTIEEYQYWLTEIRAFRLNASKEAVLVLSARNAVNDVLIDDLVGISGLEAVPEIQLDKLSDQEIDWFVEVFDENGLWADLAGRERRDKVYRLRKTCRGEIHAILLDLLESPDIAKRLQDVCDTLKMNKNYHNVLVSACVMTVLNQMPTVDTLTDIWGTEVMASSQFRRNPAVKQFLDVNANEVLVKSPVAAQYLVTKLTDPGTTISVMTKMAWQADRCASVSERYVTLLRSLMRYSHVQLVLPSDKRKAGATITYYESLKNLRRCKESPLFWLQYAIACLIIGDLFRSKKYFGTAYSLAEKSSFDTYQIDNHYARFLLVEALEGMSLKDAMENFRNARAIVNQQLTNERRHYPYRVAQQYQQFLDRWGPELSAEQLREVGGAALHVRSRIESMPTFRKGHWEIRRCKSAMDYVHARAAELLKERQGRTTKGGTVE